MSAVFAASPVSMRAMVSKVDKLGALNGEIARLQAEAEALKGAIKASGHDEIVGKNYRAVIVARDSVRLDTGAVKALLSPAQIAACSKASRSVSVSLYDL